MATDYSQAWNRYQQLYRRQLIASVAPLPLCLLFILLQDRWPPATWFAWGVGAIWIVGLLITQSEFNAWLCPRCGKDFALRLTFARKCQHCGLTKAQIKSGVAAT